MKERVNVLEGSILRTLLFLMAPLLISGICQQLYNMTDALVLGRYMGSTGIAVIGGSCQSLISLFTNIAGNLLLGCMTVIAYYYGAGDMRKNDSVITSLFLSLIVGAFFAVVYLFFARPACVVLSVPDQLLDESAEYLRLYAIGFIPYFLFQDCVIVYRSFGETKTPTKLLIGSFLLNIALDYLFVGFFAMKQSGIALAFIVTQLAAMVLALRNIHVCYMISFRQLRWNREIMQNILGVGVPACISSLCYSGTNMLIMSSMNMLGTSTLAAYAIYNKIENVFWVVMTGFGVAITTIVSQNYGAKKMERVKKSVFYGMALCFVLSFVIGSGYRILNQTLISMFTRESGTVALASEILLFMAYRLMAYPIVELFSDVMKCLGKAKASAVITVICICGSRIIWILLVARQHLTYRTVLDCYPVSWIITSTAFLIFWFLHRKEMLGI